MEFHLEFTPKFFDIKINHKQNLLLIGSCFTEQIGNKFSNHKFSVLENPNGILFNPISITKSINAYIDNKQYQEVDLFYKNECWNSWEHHSRFSTPEVNDCITGINNSQTHAHNFLKTADWLVITLGSAFVYELENNVVVANCHKVPADKFTKRLLSVEETVVEFQNLIKNLIAFNNGIKIILTISPVRHLRDGFIENNRSKSILIQTAHLLADNHSNCFYFPAYELIIDDLRDYRFFAEDMVHPNYAATNYVWEKLIDTCIDVSTQQLMKEIAVIVAAKKHKPSNPASDQHKKFRQINLDKVKKLQAQFPYIDLDEEKSYFL